MDSILVVCVGNICRSPVGERLLQAKLPEFSVSSAGIGALAGHAADDTAAEVAAQHGISLDGHVARQFSSALGQSADLILVMEAGHKRAITESRPHLSGKTMLFDQWTGAEGIPDPYTRSLEFHQSVFSLIERAADGWVRKLAPKREETNG